MLVAELFTPKLCPANTATAITYANGIGGFFCTVAGTLTLSIDGTTFINAMAVSAGLYYPLPFACVGTVTITTAGGAVGIAAVD